MLKSWGEGWVSDNNNFYAGLVFDSSNIKEFHLCPQFIRSMVKNVCIFDKSGHFYVKQKPNKSFTDCYTVVGTVYLHIWSKEFWKPKSEVPQAKECLLYCTYTFFQDIKMFHEKNIRICHWYTTTLACYLSISKWGITLIFWSATHASPMQLKY